MDDKTVVVTVGMPNGKPCEIFEAKLINDPVIKSTIPFHEKLRESIITDFSDFSGECSIDIEGTPFANQLREWMNSCNDLLSERDKKLIKKNQQRTNSMRRGLILSLSMHSYDLSLTDKRDKWKNICKAFESKLYRTKRKRFGKVVSNFYSKHPDISTRGFPHANACQLFPWWDYRFINEKTRKQHEF